MTDKEVKKAFYSETLGRLKNNETTIFTKENVVFEEPEVMLRAMAACYENRIQKYRISVGILILLIFILITRLLLLRL